MVSVAMAPSGTLLTVPETLKPDAAGASFTAGAGAAIVVSVPELAASTRPALEPEPPPASAATLTVTAAITASAPAPCARWRRRPNC